MNHIICQYIEVHINRRTGGPPVGSSSLTLSKVPSMFLFVICVKGIIQWTWLPHWQVIHFTFRLCLNLWLVTPQEYIILHQHCYCLNRERLWFPNIFSLWWNSSQKVKLTTQRAQIIKVQIKQTMRPLKRLWGVMGEVLTRPDPTNQKTTRSWPRPGWCQHSHRRTGSWPRG